MISAAISNYHLFQWDVMNWSMSLKFWQRHTQLDLSTVRALEIGAGDNGGLSLWLASLGATVICTDCETQLSNVQAFHRQFHVRGKIDYEVLDTLSINYSEQFDCILFKSVLGGIGNRKNVENQLNAVNQMHKALRPGGELLFAENMAGTQLHMALRRRFGAGRTAWRYPSLDEIHRMLEPFESYKLKTCGFIGALGRNHLQGSILGGFDRAMFNWLIPSNARYIVFGIAQKRSVPE